ncbi:aldo-keto reductase family 1 member B1-like [Schistocerca gregaria]|uniref:aldo-keto reductase family 1 member B1-like n=1 Tax=Schistocerca gregaria TaxID=7010 RepID=UPI00211EB7E3|nr:aldo-keto reductase family 1 member B1-like [Schistocerca gregaria]
MMLSLALTNLVKPLHGKRLLTSRPMSYCTESPSVTNTAKSTVPNAKLLSGLEMPVLGLGTWKSSPGLVKDSVKAALRAGYRHIDCASIYQNEKQVGEGLREGMQELGLSRSDIWITGKLWNTFHRPDLVRQACEQSLQDLGLKYLDLYLMHWPVDQIPPDGPKIAGDPSVEETPIWETYEAMNDLHKEGLVKAIGVSNFSVKEIEDLIQDTGLIPEVNQVEIHPYLPQHALVDFCHSKGIQVTAYSPLATASKPKQSQYPPLLEHELVQELAKKYARTSAQIVLRWSVQRNLVVIPKSVNENRIQENYNIWDFSLSDEDMTKLSNMNIKMRFVKPSFHVFKEEE